MLSSLVIQNLIVGAIILTAVVLLVIRASKSLRGKSKAGCGSGCGSCANSASLATSSPKLLKLGEPAQRK